MRSNFLAVIKSGVKKIGKTRLFNTLILKNTLTLEDKTVLSSVI